MNIHYPRRMAGIVAQLEPKALDIFFDQAMAFSSFRPYIVFDSLTGDDNSETPDLSEYGSGKWLKSFISDPGSPQFYGDKNKMLAFKGKISDRDLDLLVRWMTGDYHREGTTRHESKVKELEEALPNVRVQR